MNGFNLKKLSLIPKWCRNKLGDKLLWKKTIALVCVMTLFVSNLRIYGITNGSLDLVGTNKALGSPLLDDTFNVDEFQPLEVAVFGIFLSNFPLMLIDDYASAFSTNAGGSNGYGYKALQFGAGGSTIETTLQNLLNYAISTAQQPSYYKPIYYTTKNEKGEVIGGYNPADDDGNVTDDVAFKDQATLADLVYIYASLNGIAQQSGNTWEWLANKPIESLQIGGSGPVDRGDGDDAYAYAKLVVGNDQSPVGEVPYPTVVGSFAGKEFFVHPSTSTQSREVVFSHWDGYDMSMLMAQIGRMYTGVGNNYAKQFKEAMANYLSLEDAYLYLDVFGNIVMRDPATNKYLMVFPACANQYLTEKRSQNLLSAPIVGASYLDAKSSSYLVGLEADKHDLTYYGGISAVGNPASTVKGQDGSVLAYFDSDTIFDTVTGTTDIHYGETLLDIFNADLSKNNTSKSKLKIDVPGLGRSGYLAGLSHFYHATKQGISDLSNTLMEINAFGEGPRLPLFESPTIVMPNYYIGSYDVNRGLANFAYEIYSGKITDPSTLYSGLAGMTSTSLTSQLKAAKSSTDLMKLLQGSPVVGGVAGLGSRSDLAIAYNNKTNTSKDKYGWFGLPGTSYDRFIKVYQRGATMRCVNQVLSVSTDAEFAIWTPKIYYTYLEWYGLIGSKYNTLKATLFEENNFNIDSSNIVTNEISNDSMKRMIYMYMDPEEGRYLRKNVIVNLISDLFYDWYTKLVYNTSNVASGNVATVNNTTGFLNINAYADNPFTATVISNYGRLMVPILTIAVILILVAGIIGKRGVGWMLITTIVVINATLIIPSLGETVPFVSNVVQLKIFNKRLDYWSISEILQNAKLEKELYATSNGDISNEVLSLAKAFNSNFLDRSLMIRYDISRKVTETDAYDVGELQKYKTTRWLLPSIIKQYSGYNNSESYVFISMSEALDNARALYWMYEPADKLATVDESLDTESTFSGLSSSERFSLYSGYQSAATKGYASKSTEIDTPTHQSFYFIPDVNIPNIDLNKSDEEILSNITNYGSNLDAVASEIELTAGTFSSLDESTVKPIFGYLWNTESPLTYMYLTVKDSFPVESTLGEVVTELQGLYKDASSTDDEDDTDNEDEDNLVRTNFMHYERTGLVRDVMDMEEFFTNTLPYMYTVQIIAGGLDGESGYFGEDKIEDYSIYQNNNVSWLFRCNWATKLLESKELTRPETITTGGTTYIIENPLSPASYPSERPMVFSEAEMVDRGYDKSELTNIELKILRLNRNIVNRWTLLINYVNLNGMSKEVLYKQMAMIALTEFNTEFSPAGWYNERLALYPTSVELRNISFDSVMRMLMLNATRDTNNVYGDIMQNLLDNSDLLSAFLLLIVCFICVVLMPLALNLLMAMFFYIGLYSALVNIASSNKTRLVNVTAYFVDILIFLGINIGYYGLISFLMGLSSPTDVLTVGNSVIDIKSPAIVLVLLGAISILYLAIIYKMIVFIFKHKRDMGASALIGIANSVGDKISNTVSKLTDKFSSKGNQDLVVKANETAQNSWSALKRHIVGVSPSEEQSKKLQRKPRQTNEEHDDIDSSYDDKGVPKERESRTRMDDELKDSKAIDKEIAKGQNKN